MIDRKLWMFIWQLMSIMKKNYVVKQLCLEEKSEAKSVLGKDKWWLKYTTKNKEVRQQPICEKEKWKRKNYMKEKKEECVLRVRDRIEYTMKGKWKIEYSRRENWKRTHDSRESKEEIVKDSISLEDARCLERKWTRKYIRREMWRRTCVWKEYDEESMIGKNIL